MTTGPAPNAFAREQRARIVASELAEAAFEEAEQRFARGLPFEDAKRQVLEERIPGILAEHGDAVADTVIRSLMATPVSGNFYVNVHRSATEMGTIVACGNLAMTTR